MAASVTPVAPDSVVFVENVRTFTAGPGETCAALLQRIARTLAGRGETVAMLMLFGRNTATANIGQMLTGLARGKEWPVMVVEGEPCHAGPMVGAQVFTLPVAQTIRRLRLDGRVVGSVFMDGEARHCLLAGLGPRAAGAGSPGAQAQETFSALEQVLGGAGFSIADIARTWFYNRDILSWYDDFNRVRSAFYSKHPFRAGASPASTGIEGRNPGGTALALAAWAVQPLTGRTVVREIVSPLQCPAPAYGSTFSRAMEIASGGRTRLLISGTASIAPGGESVWAGDAPKQIDLTMAVIAAMLESRAMGFADVARASAYFKHAGDLAHFTAWLRARGLEHMPFLPMHCDVCRDDLLFELELDACR